MQFRGIIFDLDGTLLDSMGMWYQLDRRFLLQQGIEPPPDISEIVKSMTVDRAAAYFIERFHLHLPINEVKAQIESLAATAYQHELPLKRGAKELLTGLADRGIPCALASVTYPALLEAALTRLDVLHFFQHIRTPVDDSEGKHTPTLYLETVHSLGFQPAETVVLEDALYAAKTAKAAGFYTIGVRDVSAESDWLELEQCCDRIIDNLIELNNEAFYRQFQR